MTKSVICLGEYLVDRLFEVGQNQSSASTEWSDYPGGAPANVAAAVAKLGTPACMVSCLGKDELGDWLIQVLEAQGVICQIQRIAEAPTRVVLVERDSTGDRNFVGFSQPAPTVFADAYLSPDWINSIDFSGVDYLVMGTLGLAYPQTANAMHCASNKARQSDTKIVIDLNWRPVFWPAPDLAPAIVREFLGSADLIKLSREEALWLLGTDNVTQIRQQFPQCRALLLTDGGNGSTCITAEHCVSLPAFAVNSQDTTGAGDAFLAGFLHQLCQRGWTCLQQYEEIKNVLSYASAVGALTATKPGAIAAQPTPNEVDQFLKSHALSGTSL